MTMTTITIGTLDDDLTAIAGRILHTLARGPRMVWIDDARTAFMAHPDEVRDMPTEWIVGTFGLGHSLEAIEEDLRIVAIEWSNNAIMQESRACSSDAPERAAAMPSFQPAEGRRA